MLYRHHSNEDTEHKKFIISLINRNCLDRNFAKNFDLFRYNFEQ